MSDLIKRTLALSGPIANVGGLMTSKRRLLMSVYTAVWIRDLGCRFVIDKYCKQTVLVVAIDLPAQGRKIICERRDVAGRPRKKLEP